MPPPNEIFAVITDIIKEELGWKESLSPQHPVTELDSMQQLSLIVALEDHFEICLDPEDEKQVETLNDLVSLVQAKLKSKS